MHAGTKVAPIEPHPQASTFESLLGESRDLVCERLRVAIAAMFDKSDEALSPKPGQTQSREVQELHMEVRKTLIAHRRALETGFHQNYLSEFGKRTSQLKDAGQSFAELDGSLELVGEEDFEETLKFRAVATKLRRFCDEELTALDQRVGVLLGDANLEAEQNPFGPEAICDAYQQTCHSIDATGKVRGVLRKLFDDHVVDEVRSIYKEVNALLVSHSILPKIRYGMTKKAEDRREGAAEEKEPGAAAGTEASPEQNLFSLLQNLVGQGGAGGPGGAGGGPGGGGGAALPPGTILLQGAELLGSLTKLQRGDVSVVPGGVSAGAAAGTANVLHELKASSFGAGLQQMDATTLDIVAMLFDQLFDDPNIPAALKGLIGRLQIPMLKVAIADKSFFGKKTHPARRLLDTFGEIALQLPPDFNSESGAFVHMEAIVQHLLDNFQDDVGVFEASRAKLHDVIAEQQKSVAAETRAVTERVEQTENLAVAKTAAEDEVKIRVQAHTLPGPVLEFIIEHWLRFLLLVHAKSGRASAEWKDAVEAMDQLVWSVEPKNTTDERRKLAAMVPALVRRLVGGLNALGAEVAVRERFFAELMKYHTQGMEAKHAAKPGEEKPAETAPAAPKPALDFTAPVKIKNPYGAGEVEVTNLDFTAPPVDPKKRAAAKAAIQSSLAVDPPEKMEPGSWIEFKPKEDGAEQRKARVLFVSPKKTRYLFSDRRGQNILELSRAEIVRRLRTGEAVRLDGEPEQPLFDRIMGGLVHKLRAPAPAAAPTA
jgi:hypothetical protein